ncbi:uncharacterized protein PAC_00572 [Phialocephala subalpina]|uniref:Haloacid dehalogenase-like hydrolase n=1 Tax=Phialocephala subalpina TaxID=576137 RepID=A0A1L7WD95_9HELO|nr:uncharacterized protein PAC_00572 [Phialocephala subalpina]
MNNSSSERIGFILDFDGTITTKDTISTLAKCGISFQKDKRKDFSRAWDRIIAQYSEDYSKHVETYRPVKEERNTLQEEVEWFRSLWENEVKSFVRVSESGLFKGIQEQDWKEFGHDAVKNGEVVLRKGFQDFVTGISERGGTWGIVSVNFSYHFIRAVVGAEKAKVVVLANECTKEGYILGQEADEGGFRRVVATSDAKLASMKRLLHTWSRAPKEGFSRLIYFGDSGTDIECLVAEGVTGIVMSDDGKSDLMRTLKRIGISVLHVEEISLGGDQKQLYWARNFDEIVSSPLFASAPKA